MSISVEKFNLNWAIDGDTTSIQLYIADTAGNPVPNGSIVQFSTEGGQIQTSCQTTGIQSGASVISGCSVTFNTQDFRPLDGFVRIIAWMNGDEAYKDVNADGEYDTGEPFIDSGQIFRDDDNSGNFSPADELSIGATLAGAPGIGTSACAAAPATVNVNETPLSVPDTCNGTWGKTLIRKTVVLPVSDPRFLGIEAVGPGRVVVFTNFGSNLVAPPAGTIVSVLSPPSGCSITISPSTVGNAQIEPSEHFVTVAASAAASAPAPVCSGQTVTVEAKFSDYAPVTTQLVLP